MSNHIHLLVTEPERTNLSTAIQVIKQRFSRTTSEEFVWEPRYHDFNVFTEAKRIEKLRYMHRNPVKAGLVEEPNQWQWSSFRVYADQEDHPVQITTR
jgi:putative transposase